MASGPLKKDDFWNKWSSARDIYKNSLTDDKDKANYAIVSPQLDTYINNIPDNQRTENKIKELVGRLKEFVKDPLKIVDFLTKTPKEEKKPTDPKFEGYVDEESKVPELFTEIRAAGLAGGNIRNVVDILRKGKINLNDKDLTICVYVDKNSGFKENCSGPAPVSDKCDDVTTWLKTVKDKTKIRHDEKKVILRKMTEDELNVCLDKIRKDTGEKIEFAITKPPPPPTTGTFKHDNPAPAIVTAELDFLEKQESSSLGCGRHALNNLLGGVNFIKEYNPRLDITSIEELPNPPVALQTVCRYLETKSDYLKGETPACPDNENYHVAVLNAGMRLFGFEEFSQIQSRDPNPLDLLQTALNESTFVGFLVHLPGHWVSIKKTPSGFRYIDSLDAKNPFNGKLEDIYKNKLTTFDVITAYKYTGTTTDLIKVVTGLKCDYNNGDLVNITDTSIHPNEYDVWVVSERRFDTAQSNNCTALNLSLQSDSSIKKLDVPIGVIRKAQPPPPTQSFEEQVCNDVNTRIQAWTTANPQPALFERLNFDVLEDESRAQAESIKPPTMSFPELNAIVRRCIRQKLVSTGVISRVDHAVAILSVDETEDIPLCDYISRILAIPVYASVVSDKTGILSGEGLEELRNAASAHTKAQGLDEMDRVLEIDGCIIDALRARTPPAPPVAPPVPPPPPPPAPPVPPPPPVTIMTVDQATQVIKDALTLDVINEIVRTAIIPRDIRVAIASLLIDSKKRISAFAALIRDIVDEVDISVRIPKLSKVPLITLIKNSHNRLFNLLKNNKSRKEAVRTSYIDSETREATRGGSRTKASKINIDHLRRIIKDQYGGEKLVCQNKYPDVYKIIKGSHFKYMEKYYSIEDMLSEDHFSDELDALFEKIGYDMETKMVKTTHVDESGSAVKLVPISKIAEDCLDEPIYELLMKISEYKIPEDSDSEEDEPVVGGAGPTKIKLKVNPIQFAALVSTKDVIESLIRRGADYEVRTDAPDNKSLLEIADKRIKDDRYKDAVITLLKSVSDTINKSVIDLENDKMIDPSKLPQDPVLAYVYKKTFDEVRLSMRGKSTEDIRYRDVILKGKADGLKGVRDPEYAVIMLDEKTLEDPSPSDQRRIIYNRYYRVGEAERQGKIDGLIPNRGMDPEYYRDSDTLVADAYRKAYESVRKDNVLKGLIDGSGAKVPNIFYTGAMFGMQPEFTKFIGLKSSTDEEYQKYSEGYRRGLEVLVDKITDIKENAHGVGRADGYNGNSKYTSSLKYSFKDPTEADPAKQKTYVAEVNFGTLNMKVEGLAPGTSDTVDFITKARTALAEMKDSYDTGFSKGRADRFRSRPIGGTRRRKPRSLKRKTA